MNYEDMNKGRTGAGSQLSRIETFGFTAKNAKDAKYTEQGVLKDAKGWLTQSSIPRRPARFVAVPTAWNGSGRQESASSAGFFASCLLRPKKYKHRHSRFRLVWGADLPLSHPRPTSTRNEDFGHWKRRARTCALLEVAAVPTRLGGLLRAGKWRHFRSRHLRAD
jgi:hypothetical protein